ncbi:MAG: putative RNA-binding protein [Parcubacteria group bacterium Gr01-1014_8]|nr:MAG: putative RNA-binding protein [Parcubacteria group bacterium Gr01-1014_8]
MKSELNEIVGSVLKETLSAMGAAYSGVKYEEIAGQSVFAIQADDARSLIGMHGDTVHAIDQLVKKIVEKRLMGNRTVPIAPDENSNETHFLVDVNDYRSKQIKDLQAKALMMAERARSFQYDVELSPMSAYERLIVHTTLADSPNVKTESQGEGRSRRVVIRYTSDV